MNENQVKSEPGTQQIYQSSPDMRREFENSTGETSTVPDDNERATPQEFPERNQQHEYKNPSGNQIENDEEDDANTDGEIFSQDIENEEADPVDEQSFDTDDTDQSELSS